MGSLRADWWETDYAKGDVAIHMTGGGQGKDHPSRLWLVSYIPENSKVLDIGCCNALMYQTFKDAGKDINYTGVDRLPEFIKYCKDTYSPEARFYTSDADDLRDFDDSSFDYVVSRHVIEHLPYYSQHVIEMFRVAKKEVIIVGFLEFTGTDLDKIQWGMIEQGGSWYNRYSRTGLEAFLKYNVTENFEIIENYKDSGNSIIIIRKETLKKELP